MASTIPVPIEFALPEGWRAAEPDDVGAPEAAFVALYPDQDQGFTANITLSGQVRGTEEPLDRLADAALHRLGDVASDVRLDSRGAVGTPDNPGMTQLVRLIVDRGGAALELRQIQTLVGMADLDDPSRRVVLDVALTATNAQFDQVTEDFQRFLHTLRPDRSRMSAPPEEPASHSNG